MRLHVSADSRTPWRVVVTVKSMRRLPAFVTAATMLAGALMTFSMTSASADVYDLQADDRPIESDSCKYVRVTAEHDHGAGADVYVDTEVWSAGKNVGSLSLYNSGGYLRGRYYHCPYLDGIGKFRVGPSEVTVFTDEWEDIEYTDHSRTYYEAKQGTRVHYIKATRKGSTVTVKARGKFYAIGDGWTAISSKYEAKSNRGKNAFRLQRRNANGTGSWKTVKSARPPKGKTVTFKTKAKRTYQWRVVSIETQRSFPSKSKTVRK